MKTMKTTTHSPQEQAALEDSALNELFIDELKDIYWAENHLAKALPKMAKAATSDDLKTAIENHLKETENHVTRLESAFASIGEKATAKKCDAMAGLLEEAEGIIEDTLEGSLTRDAGIISAAQKVEHYEIASYGTLKTLAAVLGYTEAAELLAATLAEEKNADATLTGIAESYVNSSAKGEKK